MNDWKSVLKVLGSPGPIVITSHVNPDGDALGSELALASWLRTEGRDVRIINSDPAPARYAFLDPRGRCEAYEESQHRDTLSKARIVVILDVGRWDRLGPVGAVLLKSGALRVCIDHHPREASLVVEASVIDPTRAATGELLFEMMSALGRPAGAREALPLYVAIMTDTGSFRYSNTRPETHQIVGALLEHGIHTSEIYDAVYGTSSPARFRLLGEALSRLELEAGGEIVLLTVTRTLMERAGATPVDAEGFAELARGTEGCRVAAAFTETAEGSVKVSLRSRGNLDVGAVARSFGGGGHVNAAGIPATGTVDQVRGQVVAALTQALKGDTGPELT